MSTAPVKTRRGPAGSIERLKQPASPGIEAVKGRYPTERYAPAHLSQTWHEGL